MSTIFEHSTILQSILNTVNPYPSHAQISYIGQEGGRERERERERDQLLLHIPVVNYESNRETDISYCPCAPLWSLICHYNSIWFRFINMQLLNLYTTQNSQPILFNLSLTQTIETLTSLSLYVCLCIYQSQNPREKPTSRLTTQQSSIV